MTFPRLSISVLVLAAACVPASATTVIYCNISSDCPAGNLVAFDNATTSLFFPNAPILFTSAGFNSDQTNYIDPVSGTDFLDYGSNGSTIDGFTNFTGTGPLQTFVGGDVIEVTLPANVYAFETNIQVASAGGVCIETSSAYTHSCSGDNVFLSSNTDAEPVGVVSTVPITTMWFAAPSGSKLQLDNFEIGEPMSDPADTPEVATMIMIGTGLISLGVMRRRKSI
ncbi:MAG: hypothetical protein ABSB35_30360 [Bryobacteraceae bacterium]|jgi:hypothetical protein